MRIFVIILSLCFAILMAATAYALEKWAPVTEGVNAWVVLYFSQARIPMFTGFLTVGSFLLTLQTAIIQRLKDAYDTDDYKGRYLALKEKNKGAKYYGSLERMSVALSVNVTLALGTAASQMTIGFHQSVWSTAFCIALAGTSISLVVYLTIQLMLAHKEWFAKIEAEKQTHLK